MGAGVSHAESADIRAARADERRRCFDEVMTKMHECAEDATEARGEVGAYLAIELWAMCKRDAHPVEAGAALEGRDK